MAAASIARWYWRLLGVRRLLGGAAVALAAWGIIGQHGPAQTQPSQPALPAVPFWADTTLFEAARKEGTLVVYSSMNEEEALPIWRRFEEQTGIKIEYV